MNSSIHSVFEPLFSLGDRARQAAITPDHIAIGMGGHFESFGAGRSHEFENLCDDHSGQACTGSREKRNAKNYIVYSQLGDRIKHA